MRPLRHTDIRGNWATLLTPLTPSGEIDFPRLEAETDVLTASRPNGIYMNGTASEFYAQTTQEFVRIAVLLSERCEKAGINYQIGVSHPCAQTSLERLKFIRDLRPGAVQVILPEWFPVSDREAIAFLRCMAAEAQGIPLVLYNPSHAKRRLSPAEWRMLKAAVPQLVGVKVFDNDCSPAWYAEMRKAATELSVFVPGHHLATGVRYGAHGAYSNVACINPFAAQDWYDQIRCDPEGALELEGRIRRFMDECITPFIVRDGYPNHACDKFMAAVGGWCDISPTLRWPYASIPVSCIPEIRKRGRNLIPEFFQQ